MSRSNTIAGKALVGGGMNDTTNRRLRQPGQYEKLLNGRIDEALAVKKVMGRELIVTLPDTVKEILAPNRKKPLKTYTSSNNSLKFRDDVTGVSYVARISSGDYFTHVELAQALEDALNAAEDNGWLVTFTETQGLPSGAKTAAWGPPHPVLDLTAHPAGIAAGWTGTLRLNLHPSASLTLEYAHFNSTGLLRMGSEKIWYSAKPADPGGGLIDLTIPADGRGRNGTVDADHAAGVQVYMQYSAMSAAFRSAYLFLASTAGKLDVDGDGVDETDGYAWNT